MTDQHQQANTAAIKTMSNGQKPLITWFWRYHFWLITAISSSMILICAVLMDNNNNITHLQKVRADVQSQLSTLRARLEGHLNSNIQAVNGLVSAISVEPNMSQQRFSLFAKPLFEHGVHIRNIGGAPNMVITLMHPIKGNEQAIGLNYLTNPDKGQGAIIARDSSALVLAGPIDLIQGGQGFIGRIPVFSEHMVEGQSRFWGLVSAVIDANALYQASGLLDNDLTLAVAITGHDERFSSGNTFYGSDRLYTQNPVLSSIRLPFGQWQLAAVPKEGWPVIAGNAWSFRLLILLVALCILTPVLLLSWLSTQHRDQRLRLKSLFELSPLGIALNDFETGRFISINQRFSDDTGYSLDEINRLSYWDLTPEKYKDQEEKQLNDLIETHSYGPYEKQYINKKSEYYPVLLNGILITDMYGKRFIWSYVQNLTDQKQAEEKLQENNNQLELIINATQVGIWDWNIDTGALILNERWANIIGYTIEELGDITIDTWLKHAHKDDLAKSESKLNDYWQGSSDHYEFEGRMKHKQGHDVWILDTGKVIEWHNNGKPKRMVGTHLDITEKKFTEKNLAQINQSLEAQVWLIQTIANTQQDFMMNENHQSAFKKLINNINILSDSQLSFIGDVMTQDDTTKIKVVAFNGTDENLINEKLKSQFKDNGLILEKQENVFIKAAKQKEPIFFNRCDLEREPHQFPENHPEIFNYIAIPIVQKDVCIGMLGLANRELGFDQDLIDWLAPLNHTIGQLIERVESIKEKEKTELALIEAKNEAESAGRAKTEFLATMSHEIRTPMNGVLGMLILLQKSALSSEQAKKVKIAKISAESLLSIINDVLDFTKIESGKVELETIEFNIEALINDVCQAMAFKIQEKNIELIIDSTNLNNTMVKSDPVRIRQVLTNLIGNADKFTSQGEIVVKSKLVATSDAVHFHCAVSDSGIGIPDDHIKKLFTRFTQVDASTTRKFGGTGLGLSICKRICDLMDGNITVTSTEDKGSCFSFDIPVIKSEATSATTMMDLSALKVLVVHSNQTARHTIGKQLQLWSNQPMYASSGKEALQLLSNDTVDMVLIDSELDDMSGIELSTAIRSTLNDYEIQLILMTSINQIVSDDNMKQAQLNHYFAKPVTTHDLVRCFNLSSGAADDKNNHSKQPTSLQLPENAKLLLVEDIAFNQEVALMLLEEMGGHADLAENGQEAVDKVKQALAQGQGYDAILMDCQMPVMDGYDATGAIRELEKSFSHKTHIIAMTANAMSSDQQKCLDAGMDDYLSKPIDEDRLLTTLLKWLA